MSAVRLAALLLCAAACRGSEPRAPAVGAGEGVAIFVYPDEALVDARRFVEVPVGDSTLHLDGLPPVADGPLLLRSPGDPGLVLLDYRSGEARRREAGALARGQRVQVTTTSGVRRGRLVGADEHHLALATGRGPVLVARDAVLGVGMPDASGPGLRVRVRARRAGRRLVQLVYGTHAVRYTVEHQLVLVPPASAEGRGERTGEPVRPATDGWRATLHSVALLQGHDELPARRMRVTLLPGTPDRAAAAPVPLWSGPVELGPGTTRLALGAVGAALPARVEYEFRARQPVGEVSPREPHWGVASDGRVQRVVAIAGVPAPPGRVMVFERRGDGNIVTSRIEPGPGSETRIVLGPAPGLSGSRRRVQVVERPGRGLWERYELAVHNTGELAARVRIVEQLRPLEVQVQRSEPPAQRVGDALHFQVTVAPGAAARVVYEAGYRW